MMEAVDWLMELIELPYENEVEAGMGERAAGGCELCRLEYPVDPEFPLPVVPYIIPDEAMNCEAMLGADIPPPPP